MKVETLSLFDDDSYAPRRIEAADADIIYYPRLFGPITAATYQVILSEQITWQQQTLKIAGQDIALPRLTAWYGDAGYSYSGIRMEPQPWIPILLVIKSAVEKEVDISFNSVLLNLYRNGNDSVSWHADDEKELGEAPVIASLSFGAERLFQLRRKDEQHSGHLDILLADGSMIVMAGQTQRYWLHRIPKTQKQVEPRINLTFRNILS